MTWRIVAICFLLIIGGASAAILSIVGDPLPAEGPYRARQTMQCVCEVAK